MPSDQRWELFRGVLRHVEEENDLETEKLAWTTSHALMEIWREIDEEEAKAWS